MGVCGADRDVSKILKNGGVAIMSYGIEKGEMRVSRAFRSALHSPLLNDNDIYKSKKILFNIYENPNDPIRVEEMGEVEGFMEQFKEEDIELIWGLSKDHNLGEGEVKVTVLATGFGMKDIPDMKPLVEKEEEIVELLSREEQDRREKEEKKLDSMVEAFYKPDYKVYIFKGDDMHNDEFMTAIDNSPTYCRTAAELEKIIAILDKPVVTTAEPETVTEETETVCKNEENDNY